MRLCCIGMNHRTAPVEVRERFAISRDELGMALAELSEGAVVGELFILSTCNRFEVYSVPAPGVDTDEVHVELRRRLARRALASEDEIGEYAYHHFGRDAARHLFRVAASLDSMVLGETQILGQVKSSWTIAQEEGVAGTFLHRLVARAFRCAKRVRTETGIALGGVSISWVAVQLARRIFADLSKCRVLLLGAGEMAELAAVHLAEEGAASLMVANRTVERAQVIAERHGWKASQLDNVADLLREADIVISSTGSSSAVIEPNHVHSALRRRGLRPLFLIDIAVPRNVDVRVGDIDGVYLYNIDDLEAVADRNRERRSVEAQAAEDIVRDEVDKFADWVAAQAVSPVIASFRQRLMDIRDSELTRTDRVLRDLTPEQRVAIERMTAAMVSKFAGAPIARLKGATGTRDGELLAWAARELFGLVDLTVIDAHEASSMAFDDGEARDPARENAEGNR